jgi:hypothetical protein
MNSYGIREGDLPMRQIAATTADCNSFSSTNYCNIYKRSTFRVFFASWLRLNNVTLFSLISVYTCNFYS